MLLGHPVDRTQEFWYYRARWRSRFPGSQVRRDAGGGWGKYLGVREYIAYYGGGEVHRSTEEKGLR